MQTIWKYYVLPEDVNQIYDMPQGAIVLSFGVDPAGNMCFWAQVDDKAPRVPHLIACVGTGWPLDNVFAAKGRYANFIGTVTKGEYVWHLVDLGESESGRKLEVNTRE